MEHQREYEPLLADPRSPMDLARETQSTYTEAIAGDGGTKRGLHERQ